MDQARLLAEIDEEVRRKRESGDLPPGFEKELDLVFARFAPVHALEGDFDQVLAKAEEGAFIDVLAPYDSGRAAVAPVKRVVRKAILWVIRYLAEQVTAFAQAITKATRLLGERVDALESALPVAAPLGQPAHIPGLRHWKAALPKLLRGAPGRVLHAECGEGELVAGLVRARVDAYGVDPHAPDEKPGLDLRPDTMAEHLKRLPDGALGGIVLSGAIDRLPAPAKLALLDAATAKVAPDGVVVVLGTDPLAWGRDAFVVEADLAPGRPFHAETWERVLGERGFEKIVAHHEAASYAVVARRPR